MTQTEATQIALLTQELKTQSLQITELVATLKPMAELVTRHDERIGWQSKLIWAALIAAVGSAIKLVTQYVSG